MQIKIAEPLQDFYFPLYPKPKSYSARKQKASIWMQWQERRLSSSAVYLTYMSSAESGSTNQCAKFTLF